MKSFEIKSFRGGISDYEDKGISGAFKIARNLDIRKKVDSLSCQQVLADDDDSAVVGLIKFFVPASDGELYGFDDTGRIYQRDSGTWTVVYTDANGAITGAEEWFDSSGNSYLYWATATRLNRKEIPGASNWSDVNADAGWPKTNLTSATWHTMRQAGGALMICNDQYLAMVGYDNSYTNEALDIIRGNVAKTVIEREDYVLTGAGRSSNAEIGELFAWEQTALSWIKKKAVPAKGINAIIDTELTLMQAGTEGGLFFSDLVSVIPITSFPGGGQVNPDGVNSDDGLALFGVYGNGAGKSGIYSYGRKFKNHPLVLNLEYQLDCDDIGAITKVGSNIFASYKDGSSYGVKIVDSTAKATAIYESLDLKAPLNLPEKPTVWGLVELFCAPMPEDTAIEVWYRVNKNGNFVQAKMEGAVTQFTTTGEQKAVFQIGADGEIFELQLKLIPSENSSPEIYKAVIYFD